MLSLLSSVLSILALLSFTSAQSSNNSGSVFVYNGDDHAQFTFALNADKSNGDLYFHLSSSAGNVWVGAGIGTQMKDSLMLIAYPNDNGNGVTISPRIADGNSEPGYEKEISVVETSGKVTGNWDDRDIAVDGVCKGCAKWKGGSIDFENTKQPFIFALGPPLPFPIESDSPSAGLDRHMFYGHFTMDMTRATSQDGGAVPAGPYTTSIGVSAATSTKYDRNPAPHIHGFVMCIVFVLMFPAGSLALRAWNKVKAHSILQTVALVLFVMGFAGGCVMSGQYNRSKHFSSAHQVIGILLLVAFFSQMMLGVMHHAKYKKDQMPTMMGKIHRYLGPSIMLVGLLNGYVGFAFAGHRFLSIPYSIIILIVAAIYVCVRFGSKFRRRRNGAPKQTGPEGYQYSQSGPPPPYGQPDANGAYPPPYDHDVPLETYHRTQSVPLGSMPATQPRQMV